MTVCKGCGAKLQFVNQTESGYSPKKDVLFCQRCFRIRHYDDLMFSMKKGINSDDIIQRINKTQGLIIWVCDLFDFEGSMIKGLNRHLFNRDILMVATKRDLLPAEVSDHKLVSFIKERLKEAGIGIKGVLITSKNDLKNRETILSLLREYAVNKEITVIGKANAGKSTFLNLLLGEDVLTKSLYPGTTLDFNEFYIDDLKFIDTPGIEVENSLLMEVDEDDLKLIVPKQTIKPSVYQITEAQSFAVGGLLRIDFMNVKKASVIFYISNNLKIHRGKVVKADALWEKHQGNLLIPTVKEFKLLKSRKHYEKTDVVIDGLGFIRVSGEVDDMIIHYPKDVNITIRKAML